MNAQRNEADVAVRVDRVLESALKDKRVVGAVVKVAKDGELIVNRAVGSSDREAGVPMREQTAFRYASLTKPIVVATALILVEQGVLSLDDAITRWLPEFRPSFGNAPSTITVRHLLTHTSGLGYGFFEPRGDGPYHAARVSDGLDQPGLSIEENLARLGGLPLKFAPGSAWLYSLAHDVLGEVLARASGLPLPELVARYVTGPLGMTATSFGAKKMSDLATPYADGTPEPTRIEDGTVVPFGDGGVAFAPSRALRPDSYPSGGAGLVGTASDFLRFLEAIRTRAPFAPKHLLDAMTADQIAPLTSPILGDGWGYGFGVSVLRDPAAADSPMSAGSFRWGGAYGHSWFVDPRAGVSAVLLTNTTFEGMVGALRTDLERAILDQPSGERRS
ncbi:Beta-lactamase class C and other penicillin binding protein [Labilithrix luteola]|uniref:Beta-lactamase class C and other penicillin binding protein n=2 Tax=Labilithrix luteola TaxID=1391654 RepID=A0A0K1Q0J3_9BACT|nr:Beta-lactamase class C and other penicillin binding protein [Labilithrix luteola]